MKTDSQTRILCVDDDPVICKTIQRTLENAGYICNTANSVKQAKDMLYNKTFELLLTDLKMPDESGLELINWAKKKSPDMGRVMVTIVDDPLIAKDISETGIYGYVVKPFQPNMMLITVENALRLRELEMQMKVQTGAMEEKIKQHTEMLGVFMDNLDLGVVVVDRNFNIIDLNTRVLSSFPDSKKGIGKSCYHSEMFPQEREPCPDCPMAVTLTTGQRQEAIRQIHTRNGVRDFRIITSAIHSKAGEVIAGIELLEDITDKLIAENEQYKAQKLETIGQLAAGIVHEINTPVQYVSDNVNFIQEAFSDISILLKQYHYLLEEANLIDQAKEAEEDADLEYLNEEIPKAIAQTTDGILQIGKMVKVMKEFSHPGGEEKTCADLNQIIDSAVTICKNEWKYVANVEVELDQELPLVPCLAGDVSRVLVNLIVNAAHAIADADNENEAKGSIKVCSKKTDAGVRVVVTDNGSGIPQQIQERIFDSFFTTKERGKGTGQGLAMARTIIADKHGGALFFESIDGKGTTFFVDLPIDETTQATLIE